MRRVLIIDGGGCKGIIPAAVLAAIEKELKKPISEVFDLIVATSVGSLVGGSVASAKISAKELVDTMVNEIPQVFGWYLHIPILQPKYNIKNLKKTLEKCVGKDVLMGDCKTKFLCTSVNLVDGRTHFFKSWEPDDGILNLATAITRSCSAPFYFSSSVDEANEAVWCDGGTGCMNSPSIEGYVEMLLQGWAKERVHILSLGCGQSDPSVPFKKAKRYRTLRQVFRYMEPIEGGLARIQVTKAQTVWLENIAKEYDNISFQRVEEYNLPKKLDVIDGVEFRHVYQRTGEMLAKTVNYDPLRS